MKLLSIIVRRIRKNVDPLSEILLAALFRPPNTGTFRNARAIISVISNNLVAIYHTYDTTIVDPNFHNSKICQLDKTPIIRELLEKIYYYIFFISSNYYWKVIKIMQIIYLLEFLQIE